LYVGGSGGAVGTVGTVEGGGGDDIPEIDRNIYI
jgi:hypothetical protein